MPRELCVDSIIELDIKFTSNEYVTAIKGQYKVVNCTRKHHKHIDVYGLVPYDKVVTNVSKDGVETSGGLHDTSGLKIIVDLFGSVYIQDHNNRDKSNYMKVMKFDQSCVSKANLEGDDIIAADFL